MRAANIRITGEVQGVFFRESAREAAAKLGLAGFVRNESDGSVYIEVEGEDKVMEKFSAWCKHGPEGARVEDIKITRQPLNDFDGFRVER